MATDAGERVEAAEGLYLSCQPRYSRRKMGCRDRSSWSISGKIIMVEGVGVHVASSACLSCRYSKLRLPIQKVEMFKFIDNVK